MLAKWAQIAYTKMEQQRHEERTMTVARQWRNLKEAVAPVGDAVEDIGSKLATLAHLARRARHGQW